MDQLFLILKQVTLIISTIIGIVTLIAAGPIYILVSALGFVGMFLLVIGVFADIAASVKTFVVSWNDAAEIIESDVTAALVIPNNNGSAIAGFPPNLIIFSFS